MAKNRNLSVHTGRELALPLLATLFAILIFAGFYFLFDSLSVKAASTTATYVVDNTNANERCFATPDDGTTVFSSTNGVALQEAVDAATPGGTVKIAGHCAGVQSRNGATQTVYISKTLTLAGAYTISNWLSAAPGQITTTLDATGAGRVLFMEANAPLTLTALTIMNGRADVTNFGDCPGFGCGGGVSAPGMLVLDAVQVLSNTGNRGGGVHSLFGPIHATSSYFYNNLARVGQGGGIFSGARLTLSDTYLISNTGNTGGGAHVEGIVTAIGGRFERNRSGSGGGGLFGESILVMTGTQLISNTAGSVGGGLFVEGNVTLAGAHFEGNIARDNSGGALNARASVTLSDTTFLSNTSRLSGGALDVFGRLAVTNSRFERNRTTNGNGGAIIAATSLLLDHVQLIANRSSLDGGGANAESATVLSSRFENNQSGRNGGGLAAETVTVRQSDFVGNIASDDGGGAAIEDSATIEASRFENNQSEDGDGGGLSTDQATIETTLFLGNRALNEGGGAWIGQFSIGVSRIDNSLFARNRASDVGGDALYLVFDDDGSARVRYTTIVSPTQSGGIAILSGNGQVSVTNSIIAMHSTGISHTGSAAVSENFNLFFGNDLDRSDVPVGANSRSGDPAFANPASDDYHLTTNSAAINAGADVGINEDFEGDARPMAGGFDAGFDESPFTPIFLLSTSAVGDGSILVEPLQAGYEPGAVVTVSAVISPDATFLGWSGDLDGISTPETIIMNANKSVIANFSGATQATFTLTVSLTGDGSGQVTSLPAGIECGATCVTTFTFGSVVTLTATADVDNTFGGWTEDCSGVVDCVVVMEDNHEVGASFEADSPNPTQDERIHLPVLHSAEAD